MATSSKKDSFGKMKRKNSDVKPNPNFEANKKYKGSSPMGDPKLVPRIKQYLEANKHQAVVSVALMAAHIQNTYSRDYGRKKKNTFRISVEKAYEYVRSSMKTQAVKGDNYDTLEQKHLKKKKQNAETYDISSESDSDLNDDASFSSDNPDYVECEDSNGMNSFLQNMYKKPEGAAKLDTSGYNSNPCSTPGTPKHSVTDSDVDSQPVFMIDRKGDISKRLGIEYSSSPASPLRDSRGSTPSRTVEEKHNNKSGAKCDKDPVDFVSDPGSSLEISKGETSSNATGDPQGNVFKSDGKTKDTYKRQGQERDISSMDRENSHGHSAKQKRGDSKHVNANEPSQKKSAHKSTDKTSDASETKVSKTTEGKPLKKKQRTGEKRTEKESKKKSPDVQVSGVKFSDIGGNDSTLKEICKLLVHMKHPEVYERLGVTPPRGFLLHGPPGCGKTLLAHAIAGELELPFIKVAATELVSGVSGESEEKIRDTFEKAALSAPCILFLDEVDAITPKRETASKDMERRIVSQLLTCMDDLNQKTASHVLVIGATNRPDALDPALRRAGRFDREIALGIPNEDARMRILAVLCKDLRLCTDFDFTYLAHRTPGYVGADLMALAREAAITAVNRVFQNLQSDPLTSMKPQATSDKASVTMSCSSTDRDNTSSHLPVPDTNIKCVSIQQSNVLNTRTSDTRRLVNDNCSTSTPQGNLVDISDLSVEKVLEASTEPDTDNIVHVDTVTVEKSQDQRTSIGTVMKTDAEFKTVLSWLKDYPPLTEQQLDDLFITMEDFLEALLHVQPSAKREGFATVPDVTWDDIGALKSVREELQMAILAPVHHPEAFKALGVASPPGVLLAGPPGCGKTLLAKAIANESGISFISVKGPELLNMYVGESERAVRQVFQRARNSAPCVIFFDELDALCPRRTGSGEGGASVRVVNQLLTEMDGLETRKQVFIMGATNRPDIIDPAVLRPGRLDKVLYVGMPSEEDRLDILNTITKNGTKPLLAADVNLTTIARDPRCQGYTGADLAALVREAAVVALRAFMTHSQLSVQQPALQSVQPVTVSMQYFDVAFQKVCPSVSAEDQKIYAKMKARTAAPV